MKKLNNLKFNFLMFLYESFMEWYCKHVKCISSDMTLKDGRHAILYICELDDVNYKHHAPKYN